MVCWIFGTNRKILPSFTPKSWLGMKHGFTTMTQNLISSPSSGCQPVKTVQSRRKPTSLRAKFGYNFLGRKWGCAGGLSSITTPDELPTLCRSTGLSTLPYPKWKTRSFGKRIFHPAWQCFVKIVKAELDCSKLPEIDHPPYSLDLVFCDFYLFPNF